MVTISSKSESSRVSVQELEDLIIENDSGGRRPKGLTAQLLLGGALCWSLFQLWIASPLPYSIGAWLNIPILDETKSRYIHLAFALLLAYLAYPAFRRSSRLRIPIMDWVAAIAGVASCLYMLFFYEDLARRTGIPTQFDIIIGVVGILLLIEAARRTLGAPLMVISVIFLLYCYGGAVEWLPDLLRHKGQSIAKIVSHQWLTTEGVFGIALGVSTSFVFLFVLFGALLEKAGAGNYFIKVAFSLLGHLKGGPAKAAVLSSAMTGLISGSSIANVVTTGTFTVPLMRKVGFSKEKSGAVEVASSVNGQIMPPVMGAAAFLIAERINLPYDQVVKHAFIPAVISYIALLYMVHIEAVKTNMRTLPKAQTNTFFMSFLYIAIVVSSFIILSGFIYYGVGWIKVVFPEQTLYLVTIATCIIYISLLYYESKYPELPLDDPNHPMETLPETNTTVKAGLHYLLPIAALIWCLMVERLSPGLSAFWATVFMMIILVTQNPIKTFFRKEKHLFSVIVRSIYDLRDGLITGARNMIGIGVATAAAGIIVGTVSLTGIGQVLTELVEVISGGSFIIVLILTAFISLILGMGLPTTANYIVVSSLMAPVILELSQQSGLIVPLIAIHLFVFYFGIMADVTPPVGLASFAAAAVSGGDPIRTGVQAFTYSLRTVILPFIFIYNSELLLIGIDSFTHGLFIFILSTIAILLFSSALQGYFLVRNKLIETLLLLVIVHMLFLPSFWMNRVFPPEKEMDAIKLQEELAALPTGTMVKLMIDGEDDIGDKKRFVVNMPILIEGSTEEKLTAYGIALHYEKGGVIIEDVSFNSKAEQAGLYPDFIVDYFAVPQPQPNKRYVYILAILLFVFVVILQRPRQRHERIRVLMVE